MKKLLITYRATIDRDVPIAVRSQKEKKIAPRSRFVIFRQRIRVTA